MAWQDLKSKGLHNMPGVPEASSTDIAVTLAKLKAREYESLPAVNGLSNTYIIGGHEAGGKDFLFENKNPQLRNLSLDDPKHGLTSEPQPERLSRASWKFEVAVPRSRPAVW